MTVSVSTKPPATKVVPVAIQIYIGQEPIREFGLSLSPSGLEAVLTELEDLEVEGEN